MVQAKVAAAHDRPRHSVRAGARAAPFDERDLPPPPSSPLSVSAAAADIRAAQLLQPLRALNAAPTLGAQAELLLRFRAAEGRWGAEAVRGGAPARRS
jgi:hypothetical protein